MLRDIGDAAAPVLLCFDFKEVAPRVSSEGLLGDHRGIKKLDVTHVLPLFSLH